MNVPGDNRPQNLGLLIEKGFVKLLSSFFGKFSVKGFYRIASWLYSYRRHALQSGVWITKSYLAAKYNLKIHLFSKDLIDHKILFSGVYEKETNWVLENHINEGDIVLEAGANSGTETLLISRLVRESGEVYAFEPANDVATKLKENLTLNSINNVRVNSTALGEKMGIISFFILPGDHPNQGMGSKVPNNRALTEIKVNQITLDSLQLSRLDFLKMDVQGAELDILNGGRNTILNLRPAIFLEAGEGWSNIRDLQVRLDELGYTIYFVSSKLNLIPLNQPNLKPGNWLALPNK